MMILACCNASGNHKLKLAWTKKKKKKRKTRALKTPRALPILYNSQKKCVDLLTDNYQKLFFSLNPPL
jgi:hypothetical protein